MPPVFFKDAVSPRLIRYGRLWPPLLYSTSPVRISKTAQKTVTNMHVSLSRHISRFNRDKILSGPLTLLAVVLKRVLVTAINRAAGIPLPETSPRSEERRVGKE